MTNQPALLFVHGSWHTPAYWKSTTESLESKGYKCIAPHLPFSGPSEPPTTSLKPDIDILQSIIRSETSSGQNVVVICHSFGGVSGCSSVKGYTRKNSSALSNNTQTGHVVGVIVIAGFALATNACMFDILPERKTDFWDANDENGWIELHSPVSETVKERFYHDLPAAQADEFAKLIVKQSVGAYSDKENGYAGWADVPLWYVVAKDDKALPPAVQEMLYKAAKEQGADVTVKELDCAHSVMVAKPKETLQIIEDAVEAFTKADAH